MMVSAMRGAFGTRRCQCWPDVEFECLPMPGPGNSAAYLCFAAPKGHRQTSPGQGNTSPASVAAALGWRPLDPPSPEGAEQNACERPSLFQRVRGRPGTGLPLPVVAVGSIPHIYRREDFLHRATPIEIAPARSHSESFRMARQKSSRLSKPRFLRK